MSSSAILRKRILVIGATGRQGGATVKSLLALPNNPFAIVALSRKADSPSAVRLQSIKDVQVVQGDLSDPNQIFKAAGGDIWGVFSVSVHGKEEESQGKAMVDAALKNGVRHFVYASVNRNGDKPTKVPHFISKHNIEQHLKARSNGTTMAWTILQPVAFLDNFGVKGFASIFGALLKGQMGPSNKSLQFIASSDIGFFAAKAFAEEMRDQTISLAGDDLTYTQIESIFQQTTGAPLPRAPTFVGGLLSWLVRDVRLMFEFFKEEGYGVDISALKKKHKGLKGLKEWIETESQWTKK